MKAYKLMKPVGTDGIELDANCSSPEPGPGAMRVRMRAASLNYRDLLVAAGRYGAGTKANVIPLSDGAGEVVALGPGVSRFKIGDRVAANFFPDWIGGELTAEATKRALGGAVDGMLAEEVVLAETAAVAVPDHLSFEEAATLPCAALTAWNALVEVGRLFAGQTVLLLGTGGVSLFALQFAKLHGARTIILSGSDEKLKRAASLGADATINYRTVTEWDKDVLGLTDGRGVDLVVEVGGPGTLARSLKAVRAGGTVVMIGLVAGTGEINPMPLVSKGIRLQGIYVGSRVLFENMNRAIAKAGLRPVIDQIFAFNDAPDAYRRLTEASHFGKLVVRI